VTKPVRTAPKVAEQTSIEHASVTVRNGWCVCEVCRRSWRDGAARLPKCAPRAAQTVYHG
jgi:hypothetical protein